MAANAARHDMRVGIVRQLLLETTPLAMHGCSSCIAGELMLLVDLQIHCVSCISACKQLSVLLWRHPNKRDYALYLQTVLLCCL